MKSLWSIFLLLSFILLAGCAKKEPDLSKATLQKVKPGVFVHTSYGKFGENIYPANGLVYFDGDKAVLVDTPWTDEQTEYLINLIGTKYNKSVELVILTHFHTDNLGGIGYLKKSRIRAVSTKLTQKLASERYGIILDHPVITEDVWEHTVNRKKLEVYYPGPGHSQDNVVVWLEEEKILFGGCILKNLSANGKGNTADADLEKWPISVSNLINRYPNVEVVIPGHGEWGGTDLLHHTLEIVKK